MKRMVQHHAANGWGDDTAQPVDVPSTKDSQPAADGALLLGRYVPCMLEPAHQGSVQRLMLSLEALVARESGRACTCLFHSFQRLDACYGRVLPLVQPRAPRGARAVASCPGCAMVLSTP